MNFVAPALLFGLCAALIPTIVHLIGKRRARPVRFAAMQLLLRAERRVSARRRLREVLLLVARTAVAALLPFIFAQPFRETEADVPAVTFDPQSAVVVLDDSASLRRARGRGTVFDVARDRARSLLRQLPSDSEAALVLASEGSSPPVAQLVPERTRLLEALEGARCSARPANFAAALARAAGLLASSPRPRRRIYVISDLQAAGWDPPPRLPERGGPEVVVLDVSDGQPWDNRAVLDIEAEATPEAGAGSVTVSAEIADFSRKGSAGLGVSLKVDGVAVARSFVDLVAGGRSRKRFLHILPPGSHDLEVEIDPDGYSLDDRRSTRFETRRALRFLLVNGDRRTVRTEDETFFLETALRSGSDTAALTTVVPDDIAVETLGQYTAVFFANVAEPTPQVAQGLARWVEGGGGLFLSVGDRVGIASWNDRFARLLPQPLGLLRTAAALPGQRAGETVDDRPAERLAPIDRRHPVLARFPPQGEGLSSARFFKFVLLDPVSDASESAVILRYESGAPALVERPLGKGRVMLLTTTIDRDWTDLPIRPGFLPLVDEAVRRLAGTPAREGAGAMLVGAAREFALAPDDRQVEVTRPDGSVWVGRSDRARADRRVVFHETDEPGQYRVRAVGADGAIVPRPEDAFVVNVDTAESNPEALSRDRRPDRAPIAGGAPPKRRIELWHALAAAVVALVLIESLLTLRFRRSSLARARPIAS